MVAEIRGLLFCARILDINSAAINYRNTQGTKGVERSETPLPRKQRITLRANPYTSLWFVILLKKSGY